MSVDSFTHASLLVVVRFLSDTDEFVAPHMEQQFELDLRYLVACLHVRKRLGCGLSMVEHG
jgi:hypothetical protein